jgi:hypothetical protein
MKARDAVIVTATVLSRMSPEDRAAVARVITMPGKLEAVTRQAIFDDVKAIATRSVNREVTVGRVVDALGEMAESLKR